MVSCILSREGVPRKVCNKNLWPPFSSWQISEILGHMFDLRDHLAHCWPGVETPTKRHRDPAPRAHSQGPDKPRGGDGDRARMDQQRRTVHRKQQGEDGGVQEAVHDGQSPRH